MSQLVVDVLQDGAIVLLAVTSIRQSNVLARLRDRMDGFEGLVSSWKHSLDRQKLDDVEQSRRESNYRFHISHKSDQE